MKRADAAGPKVGAALTLSPHQRHRASFEPMDTATKNRADAAGPEPTTAALAIRPLSEMTRDRSLEDLDDEDAVIVGRAFTNLPPPVAISIMGSGMIVIGGMAALGFASPLSVSILAVIVGGATVLAHWRRMRQQLRFELVRRAARFAAPSDEAWVHVAHARKEV